MDTQKRQARAQERETHQLGSFADMERQMPMLTCRSKCSARDNWTSYLGQRNPFARPLNPTSDELWLFDNTAFRQTTADGGGEEAWHAEFVAAYFLRDSGEDKGAVVADVATKLGLADSDTAEQATLRDRIQPFVDAILPARTVTVTLDIPQTPSPSSVNLGASDRSGISVNLHRIPGCEHLSDGSRIKTHAPESGLPNSTHNPEAHMVTHFAGPEGWAVISDIDDTIKRTLTSSPVGILRSTFATPTPDPIRGMPELYAHIDSHLAKPAWFYLSASPYNLYPFLRQFRAQHYPAGSIILRDASWMNLAGFLASLTQGTQSYKTGQIEKIHGYLPKRKLLCVGDTTQTDPESYAEMYRKFPTWIKAIYIRKVTGVAALDESDKNSDERIQKAFKGVPNTVWRVFEQPEELYDAVNALKVEG